MSVARAQHDEAINAARDGLSVLWVQTNATNALLGLAEHFGAEHVSYVNGLQHAEFSNGGRIDILPTATSVRGRTADLIYVDTNAVIEDREALMPCIQTTAGQIHLIGGRIA
ncbi:hypothetical protein [Microbacterium sp.]|uniref:hypothetical protein n=1 Tax=Microbacterium sp. TaxID=51671 RepID=UPI002FE1FB32